MSEGRGGAPSSPCWSSPDSTPGWASAALLGSAGILPAQQPLGSRPRAGSAGGLLAAGRGAAAGTERAHALPISMLNPRRA